MNSFIRFFILLLLTTSASLYAQSSTSPEFDANELRSHITYPDRAVEDFLEGRLDSLLEGTVVIATILRPDGGVSSAEVTSSAAPMLDSVALAAVLNHPVVSARATSPASEISNNVIIQFDPYYTMDSTDHADTLIVGMSSQQRKLVRVDEKDPEFKPSEPGNRVRYPEEARKNGIEGKVVLHVYVEKDGTVGNIRIVRSTNDVFNDAAVDAIKGTKFKPKRRKDRPVASWITIPINFNFGQ